MSRRDDLLPRADPVKRPGGALWFLAVLGLYWGAVIAGGIVLAVVLYIRLGRAPGERDIPVAVAIALDMAAKGFSLAALWAIFRLRKEPLALVRRDPGPGRAVAGGAVAGLAFLPVATGASMLQVWVYGREVQLQDIVLQAAEASAPAFALVAIFAVAIAPPFEEFAFRGFLHSGLRNRLGPLAASSITALVFAGYHFHLDAIPVLFLFGLWLSWLRERTGGLTAPIAAHACYNAYQMAGVWMARSSGG
jgi:membrane protease YdiL (CAAX protease family)